MASDRSWIKLRNRNDPAFLNGIQSFIETAINHQDSEGRIYCPCKKCNNFRKQQPDLVKDHIHAFGFVQSYDIWVHHGEKYPYSPAVASLLNHKNKKHTQSTSSETHSTNSEMFDVIQDVILENVTHEETVDADEVEDTTTASNKEFDELFAELNTDLYPGCDWMSSLNFLAKLMHIKVTNKWTNTSFNQLVKFLRTAFPKDNHVPVSYNEAKKKLKTIGLGYQSIDACINDCALFWKENESKENCPVCGESRYADKNTRGKKVPRKRMRYFPLTARLRRLYASKFTAKEMIWHHTGRSTDSMMRHPVDGKEWQEFNDRYPDFAEEPRNVRLGLAADGFNPFGNLSQAYSMWPVVLTTYNTPPWICMKESSMMLTLLIPGPKSPGKDMDVFLRPLVEELKTLWADGVQTRDASTNVIFTMRAALLWTINDFPARSSLSGWSGQGYQACSTCNKDTPSRYVKSKVAYVGHRRFLPVKHKLRDSLLFNGEKEKRKAPRRLTSKQILEQLETLPNLVPGKHPRYGGVKRKRDKSELNWTKRSIFYELDYWSSIELKHNLDVMHIEKNVCESVLGTLLMNDKSKDTHKAREDLKDLGIREELWQKTDKNKKTYYPQAPYSFSPDDRQRFCNFIKGVRLPDGFGSNFKKKVVGSNIIGLKSHDYHILMQRLLPVGVRAGLSADASKTIIDLCTFFKKICARSVSERDMRDANTQIVKILCNLELIYPPAFFDIMVHVVLHLPEEAIRGGPVYMRWMYPFERYMKTLKAYVRNKARPEGSIAEGYIADEALKFCSIYLKGVETKFNRPDRNPDDDPPNRQYNVFASQCQPISSKKIIPLCAKAKSSFLWFVLDNCSTELETYLSEFKSSFPESNLETAFPSWLSKRIYDSPDCTDELKALAHGPLHAVSYTACIANGVRFVAHSRDCTRTTQNSGVISFGEDSTPFYGELEEIIELKYLSDYSVVLFRCKWFKTSGKGRRLEKDNLVFINASVDMYPHIEWYDYRQYVLATQAKQVFYLQDLTKSTGDWRVVETVHHRKLWDYPSPSVASDIDVLHDTQSSDYNLIVEPDLESDYNPIVESMDVEGGDSSSNRPIGDDEEFEEDDAEDESTDTSDQEEGDEFEENVDFDHVDIYHSSDDSD